MKLYYDGAPTATGTDSRTLSNAIDFHIGASGDLSPGNWFSGIIDEVRISNTNRSADWILTEYNNQKTPATFHYYATEESAPPESGSQLFTW